MKMVLGIYKLVAKNVVILMFQVIMIYLKLKIVLNVGKKIDLLVKKHF